MVFESSILRVDKSYRITLPQSLWQHVNWIRGDEPAKAWLAMENPGRCRLLSASDAESDASVKSLKARIEAELNRPIPNPLEFHDEAAIALALRLVSVQVTPPQPGWRLTFPRPIAAIMGLRPGESDIAGLFLHGYIEFWSVEVLRAAANTPLIQSF